MKTYRTLGFSLLVSAMLLAGFASNALALTGACVTIANQATLSYSVGGVPQANINSDGSAAPGVQTTDFLVATKIDLTVSAFNSPVTATGVDQVLIYRITNTGNDTQRYQLQLYTGAGETVGAFTDNFNMSNVRVYVDTTPDGSYDGDETLLATNPANGADMGLTADVAGMVGAGPYNNVIEVIVRADVPAGRTTGDDAIYTLKARTYQTAANPGAGGVNGAEADSTAQTQNSCSSGVVLADGTATDTPVGGATDAGNDGDYFATGIYTVSAANIAVAKTVTVLWDPVNELVTPKAIPGAYVKYAITVSNTGAASATLTTITDALAGSLAIDPDLVTDANPITPENAAGDGFKVTHVSARTLASPLYYSSANDADGVEHNAGTVTATFATLLPAEAGYSAGELKSGESVTLTFNAIIQ